MPKDKEEKVREAIGLFDPAVVAMAASDMGIDEKEVKRAKASIEKALGSITNDGEKKALLLSRAGAEIRSDLMRKEVESIKKVLGLRGV